MTNSLVSELAQRLGKSEEEVIRFFQTLWQILPPSPETQPYFFRYLDERFLRLEDRYENLRKEMQQGYAFLRERMEALHSETIRQVEGLRSEMTRKVEGLREEMLGQIEGLRKDMEQGNKSLREEMLGQIEGLRKDMEHQRESLLSQIKHGDDLLRQKIDAVSQHVERLEKWLFALTVPVLVSTIGIVGILIQLYLSR